MGSYMDTLATAPATSTATMAAAGGVVSYTTGPLDGTTLNATLNIVTTSNGLNFYPTHLIVTVTATAGAFVSAASLSVGAGGSTTNILAASALTGLSVTGQFLALPITLAATRVASGQTITAKITTAVVGLSQLSLQLTIAGFYAA